MLYPFLCLNLGVDSSCGGRYKRFQFLLRNKKLVVGLPAAAAGSVGVFLSSDPGLKGVFWPKGLRLRLASEVLVDGDLERRSKREERLGSGSVWSNRERLELLRSSSAIIILLLRCYSSEVARSWWWFKKSGV